MQVLPFYTLKLRGNIISPNECNAMYLMYCYLTGLNWPTFLAYAPDRTRSSLVE